MMPISPILKSIKQKSWTWNNIASGHVSGNKAFEALSKGSHKAGFLKWIGSACDSYKLYNQAHSFGLFQRYPGLVKPFKYGVIAVTAFNFCTVVYKSVCASLRAKGEASGFYAGSVLWNFTQRANAMGSIVAAAFEYKTRPMRTAAFFTTGAITLLDQTHQLSTDASFWWKKTPRISRCNLFWTGTWTDRSVIALKMGTTYF